MIFLPIWYIRRIQDTIKGQNVTDRTLGNALIVKDISKCFPRYILLVGHQRGSTNDLLENIFAEKTG